MGEVLLFADDRQYFSDNSPAPLRYVLMNALQAPELHTMENLLLQAREKWPNYADAHIALYKFYFVNKRYAEAERAVWNALRIAADEAGFTRNYRRLTPASSNWEIRHGPVRLYLFSLKALGVIRLRRAKVKLAKTVLQKLLELDPVDEIGGGAFLSIARSFDEED